MQSEQHLSNILSKQLSNWWVFKGEKFDAGMAALHCIYNSDLSNWQSHAVSEGTKFVHHHQDADKQYAIEILNSGPKIVLGRQDILEGQAAAVITDTFWERVEARREKIQLSLSEITGRLSNITQNQCELLVKVTECKVGSAHYRASHSLRSIDLLFDEVPLTLTQSSSGRDGVWYAQFSNSDSCVGLALERVPVSYSSVNNILFTFPAVEKMLYGEVPYEDRKALKKEFSNTRDSMTLQQMLDAEAIVKDFLRGNINPKFERKSTNKTEFTGKNGKSNIKLSFNNGDISVTTSVDSLSLGTRIEQSKITAQQYTNFLRRRVTTNALAAGLPVVTVNPYRDSRSIKPNDPYFIMTRDGSQFECFVSDGSRGDNITIKAILTRPEGSRIAQLETDFGPGGKGATEFAVIKGIPASKCTLSEASLTKLGEGWKIFQRFSFTDAESLYDALHKVTASFHDSGIRASAYTPIIIPARIDRTTDTAYICAPISTVSSTCNLTNAFTSFFSKKVSSHEIEEDSLRKLIVELTGCGKVIAVPGAANKPKSDDVKKNDEDRELELTIFSGLKSLDEERVEQAREQMERQQKEEEKLKSEREREIAEELSSEWTRRILELQQIREQEIARARRNRDRGFERER